MQAEPWKNFWNLTEGTPSGIDHVAIDNDKWSLSILLMDAK